MDKNLKKASVINMGCKVNSYESQAMTELLISRGYEIVSPKEDADLYLVNTCTVTQIAARKSRQELRSLRRDHKQALIIATGCYVEQMDTGEEDILLKKVQSPAAEELLKDHTVDIIVPNRRKKDLLAIMDAYAAVQSPAEAIARSSCAEPELCISTQEDRTRAFLKVQDGCRQFCSYCIIPYVRGSLVSKPLCEAVREAEALARNGFCEIVLTGIHLSSYGRGEDWDLADLILAVNDIPEVSRIRLGSLEPRVMTEEFLTRIAPAKKLCPHFHLSLQSGADKTLKAMNRHYAAGEYAETLARIRRYYPDVAFTTDVIVGFPGETEEDHKASLEFVRDCGFAQVHVFRYSRREGTVADRMEGQVSDYAKKRRSEEMIALCEQAEEAWLTGHIGRKTELLPEELIDGKWYGHSRDYALLCVGNVPGIRRGEPVTVIPKCLNHSEKGLLLEAECK